MSQAKNKVQWCLNKAKRELAENGLHRGLVEVPSNAVLARKHLAKAKHNLDAAIFFDENGYSDWSASAFFYCLYHCLLAILRKHGYESRNQECTLAVIAFLREEGVIELEEGFVNMLLISKAKEIDLSIIKIREEFQYGVGFLYEDRTLFDASLKVCQTLLYNAQKIVDQT